MSRQWEILVTERPAGRGACRCEACDGPKRRGLPQYLVRWHHKSKDNWMGAYVACSPECVETIANRMRELGTPRKKDGYYESTDYLFDKPKAPVTLPYEEWLAKQHATGGAKAWKPTRRIRVEAELLRIERDSELRSDVAVFRWGLTPAKWEPQYFVLPIDPQTKAELEEATSVQFEIVSCFRSETDA